MQYTVMPFGLKNSPVTFQRLANIVLADVSNCTAYLDDLVVHLYDWESHVESLRVVFSKLCQTNLTLNLVECEFAHATVVYLGWSGNRLSFKG